jgi:hypothetical protein
MGITADSGPQIYHPLLPGQAIREDNTGRTGTIQAVSSSLAEAGPGQIATILFGQGSRDEQFGLLAGTARYDSQKAAATLLMSDSKDGSRTGVLLHGSLGDGSAYNAAHSFTTGVLATENTGLSLHGTMFVYEPSQSGLLASVGAQAPGTDSLGNKYLRGVVAYNGTTFVVQLDPVTGGLLLGDPSTAHALASVTSGQDGFVSVASGETNSSDTIAQLGLYSKNAGPVTINGRPQIYGSDLFSINEYTNNLTNNTSWNNMVLSHSWANSGHGPAGRYRRVAAPPNSVEIIGDLTAGTIRNGTVITTLPSGYTPDTEQAIGVCVLSGTPTRPAASRLAVLTNGQVQCFGLAGLARGSRIAFHGFVSLDA